MAWTPEHISALITGHNNGSLSEEQTSELDKWINDSDENRKLFEELTDPDVLRAYLKQMDGFD